MSKKNKKKISERDYLMVELIKGATKASVHKDRKKEASKHRCRSKKTEED